MSTPAPTPASVAARRIGPGDRWLSSAAAATVAGLAGIAGVLSYSHMRQLAQDHGQVGWHAHAFPLSVDGIEVVASLVLLADRRAGRRPGWLPWTALGAGTVGSLAANIATAHPDPVSRIIAGWPALALLVAIKLLTGILERHPVADLPAAASQPTPRSSTPDTGQNHPAPRLLGRTRPALSDSNTQSRSGRSTTPPSRPVPKQSNTKLLAIDLAPGVAALLPAARCARDELCRDGRALTRHALASHLRRHGHPIRNANLTPLLGQLRREQYPDTNHDPAERAA